MPNLRIINRYCRKCNDNLWNVSPSTGKVLQCASCQRELMKAYNKTANGKRILDKARKKQRDNLTDNYIIQNLATNLYLSGGHKLDRKSVPQEIIEKARQVILAKRQLRKMKNENREET
jgi:DNA-directed RNA polymerase subunit M/transcription elongation factor TFIIS